MHGPPFLRSPAIAIAIAIATLAGCSRNGGNAVDTSAVVPPPAPPPAPRARMGMMMGDSAMIMLDGFCGAEEGDSTMGAHVDLIVNGDAALRGSMVMINVTSAPPGNLKAELVAGRNARAMCGGHARRIYIGGTTMFLGNPTLTLSSAVPVSVAARSTTSAMLGPPIEVKPGQKGAILKWDAPSEPQH